MNFHLSAFLKGMWEFRRTYTQHYHNWGAMCSYDFGRELAHKLTLRRFQ